MLLRSSRLEARCGFPVKGFLSFDFSTPEFYLNRLIAYRDAAPILLADWVFVLWLLFRDTSVFTGFNHQFPTNLFGLRQSVSELTSL